MECMIDGLKLNYEIAGEGQPLLMLHGWGSNLQAFQCLVPALSDKYQVIRLDFPGFGKSSPVPRVFCVDDYVDITIKFIQFLQLTKLSLAGHSFGGRVIIKLNSRQKLPFEIDKNILIDSAGILPVKTLKKIVRQRVFKMGKAVLNLPPVKAAFPDALDRFRAHFGSADYNAATGFLRDTMVKAINEDLQPYLKNIARPTLLIWGDQDTATPMRDAHIMEKEIPDAGLVVVKNAGHFSFLKDPYLVIAVIQSFLG